MIPFFRHDVLIVTRAKRIFYDKAMLLDASIVEIVTRLSPTPTEDRPYGLKYRLFYGRDEKRIAGYDNKRGRGDHKHLDGLLVRDGRELHAPWDEVRASVSPAM